MPSPGDSYIDCSNAKTLLSQEQILRLLTVYDCNGKPALRTYDACQTGGGGGSFPSPVGHTPNISRVSQESDTGAGASSITFVNTGSADGLVAGTILHPGESVTFSAPMWDTINSIHYDSSSTEFLISSL